MTTFTYSIKNFESFDDQIEDKRPINLEGAIDTFQSLLSKRLLLQKEEDESYSPTITFYRLEGISLSIWASSNEGYSLLYENRNKTSEFFISKDFNLNPEGRNVEEFIEQFFNETIEESIELEEHSASYNIENQLTKQKQIVTFSFHETKKIKHYLWSIPFLLLSLYLLVFHYNKFIELGWGLQLIISIMWLPSTIVYLTYWFKNKNAKVTINKKERTIEYEKDGQLTKFNLDEIYNCEIIEDRSWTNYRYLHIRLNDHRRVVITNFITEPENIIDLLKLKHTSSVRIFAFLPIF